MVCDFLLKMLLNIMLGEFYKEQLCLIISLKDDFELFMVEII